MNVFAPCRWPLGLIAVAIGLAIGGGRGLAQEATPGGGDQMTAHHPAHIHKGTCAQPEGAAAYTLSEIGMNMAEQGKGPTVPVEISVITIDAKLADLLASPYAIDVHEVKELGAALAGTIACGDVGGQPTGDRLAVGVKEIKGSGFSGIAVLQAAGAKTTVTLYMAHGLSGVMHDEMTPQASAATVAFHVLTLTCPGCEARVRASLTKAPGIQAVAVDGQDVTVTYDPSQVTPAQIRAAIEAGGDTVEPKGS